MATEKIKKIRLIISRPDVANVLCELMLLGCVEISSRDELLDDPELASLVSLERSELETCLSDQASLDRALDILDTYSPEVAGAPVAKQELTLDKLLFETYPESCLMLAKSLETLDSMMLILPAEEHAELVSQIREAAAHRESIKLCYDHYSVRILLAQTIEKMLGTDRTLLLTGWTTSKTEIELESKLSQYICAWELTTPTPGETANVPAMQKTTKLFGRFQNNDGKLFDPLVLKTKYVEVIRG